MGGYVAQQMSFVELYFSFKGRINRVTFWLRGWLPLMLINLVGAFIDVGGTGEPGQAFLICNLLTLWPGIAIAVKRLHDRDRSGWLMLITLIPILGFIWFLVEVGFLKGTDGDNRFGSDPLQPTDYVEI